MVPEQLPAVEFTRRWSLHILPKGFVKVRHYGGFSNTKRKSYLACCRESLGLVGTNQIDKDEQEVGDSASETEQELLACPHCRQPMTCLQSTHRPSWSKTLSSSYRPAWYHDN